MDAKKCAKLEANRVQNGYVTETTIQKANRSKRKRVGRRRRGKKDVILDFTKRAKPKKKAAEGSTVEGKPNNKITISHSDKHKMANINVQPSSQQADMAPTFSNFKNKAKSNKGKLSLTTGTRDYGGNLALPEKVSQREHETTGQFFRRLDRLAAKAKVEASLESRFDMTLRKS